MLQYRDPWVGRRITIAEQATPSQGDGIFELDTSVSSGLACVNAGQAVLTTLDVDQTARVNGGYVDIGAQESP